MRLLRQSLAILGLFLFSCACGPSRRKSSWTNEIRAAAYATCREELSGDREFCACLTETLEFVEPNPEDVTPEKAQAAASACPRPASEAEKA
jgi:hypothetical protein